MQRFNLPVFFFALGTVALFSAVAVADDAVELLDGTKVVGKVEHYYDGVLSLTLPNGTAMRLPASKIRRVSFQLPKPQKAFATPQKTFEVMNKAVQKGDLERYVECHSSYYQMFLNHQISMAGPKEFARRLKEEWGQGKLTVLKTDIKGNTAVMKVNRAAGSEKQDGELRFVKENREWKMILPL